jgi:integrase
MSKVEQTLVWKKTSVPNLIQYVPSGVYYVRARVSGKLFYESLKTTTFSVAKLRLEDKMKERRTLAVTADPVTTGKMAWGEAVSTYRQQIQSSTRLKPKSKKYRLMTIDFIEKSWPGLATEEARKISKRDCEKWLDRFHKKYAASVVNNCIGTMRAVFEIVVKAGVRFDNPAARLQRSKIRQKRLDLPSREQFAKFVESIRTAGARQSKDCADFVRFLAFTGLRKGEAKHLSWRDVNFAHDEIVVRGDPENGTKNDEIRHVPMIPEAKEMLLKMRSERQNEPADALVLRVNEAENSMSRAAHEVGIPRMRHHDLRHLFASTCIESGVDIPTVSRWLGHKDGGALAMRVYGHLRRDHSLSQARKVSFSA